MHKFICIVLLNLIILAFAMFTILKKQLKENKNASGAVKAYTIPVSSIEVKFKEISNW